MHACLLKLNIKQSFTTLSYNMPGKVSVVIKLTRSYEEGAIKLFFDDGSKIILGEARVAIQVLK
jgi:hypothetical protein